ILGRPDRVARNGFRRLDRDKIPGLLFFQRSRDDDSQTLAYGRLSRFMLIELFGIPQSQVPRRAVEGADEAGFFQDFHHSWFQRAIKDRIAAVVVEVSD